MHILTVAESSVPNIGNLKPGRYVMEDTNAAEFMLMNQASNPELEPLRLWELGTSKRTLILGTMGFGDAIMLTPVLRAMKADRPDHEIIISCWPAQRQVFLNLPYVDGYTDYPLPYESLAEYGDVRFLEHAVEFNPKAKTQHMTNRFAEHLGFAPDYEFDRKPELRLTGDEETWAWETFPRHDGKRRIGIQVQAGVRCRTYPMSKIAGITRNKDGTLNIRMIDQMVQEGWEVHLLGNPGEFLIESLPKGVVDMTRLGLTFRQTVAFLKTCDAVLAPDSSIMHAAGALDIPCVALFGPFPHVIRTKYYPSVFALHGPGKCPLAPCFHTFHNGLPMFPPGGPCNATGICDELAAIEPERVRAKLEQIAKRAPSKAASPAVQVPPSGDAPPRTG